MSDDPRERRHRLLAPAGVGALFLAVYLATLAPDITFWDAGEFIAAAHSVGIPHPPGTPLYVLLLAVWARALPFVDFAVATNAFSAFVTALAAALTVRLLDIGMRDRLLAVAAAVCAGGMASAWLNATETEVYAASLALATVTIVAAERAGRRRSTRGRLLVAYLLALAVPLHLSALLAAPAAIYLAASDRDHGVDVPTLLALLGVTVGVVGIATARVLAGATGATLLVASSVVSVIRDRRTGEGARVAATIGRLAAYAVVTTLGVSLVAFMVLRARHDPAINQGNPDDWSTLFYVLARKQYAVPPLWPRGAPWWLQIANYFEYVDWQVALSLAPGVMTSVGRVAFTTMFLALGVFGSVVHRRMDRRGWRGIALLTLAGSLGAVAYLNLKASPSFGWGILPANAIREARERDYFFVLSFWGWGVWAGAGAVSLVRRRGWPAWAGVAAAALPLALNWRAVERRSAPESGIPRVFGEAILRAAPPNAVLFVGGDNDTYVPWALQTVDGLRRDVTVVTLPLLAAGWNQQEVARRTGLLGPDAPRMPTFEAARAIAREAGARGRPVATTVMVTRSERSRLGSGWTARGMVYVAARPGEPEQGSASAPRDAAVPTLAVDTTATRAWAQVIERWRRGRDARLFVDPINRHMMELLSCPTLLVVPRPTEEQVRLLDKTCNRR